MTRIVLLSDTHNKHKEIQLPEGDIVIHAGDVSMRGSIEEIRSFLHWYDRTPYKVKIFCAGNHDWLFQKNPTLARSLVDETESVVYLQDELVEVEGLKIWGSPYQSWYGNYAFNFPRNDPGQNYKQARRIWGMIPNEIDILVTHGPAYGILDKTFDGRKTGCPVLYEAVMKYVRPKLFIFGHIHESRNFEELDSGTILAINASSCNKDYKCINKPIVVDIVDGKTRIKSH